MTTEARGILADRVALITGGTAGIGLATALALGREGAHCVLTYRWGSANEADIRAAFAGCAAPEPLIVEADVSNGEDTAALLAAVRERHAGVDIFVSNVAFAQVVRSLDDYTQRALHQSIDYTVWPLIAYTLRIREMFGAFPRHIVGLSSVGPDEFVANYDFVAACKSMLETFSRYLAYRLGDTTRVNIVRGGPVRTESLRAVLGTDFDAFAARHGLSDSLLAPEEIASVILTLCSGLLDGVNGQVIVADRGASLRMASLDIERIAATIPPRL